MSDDLGSTVRHPAGRAWLGGLRRPGVLTSVIGSTGLLLTLGVAVALTGPTPAASGVSGPSTAAGGCRPEPGQPAIPPDARTAPIRHLGGSAGPDTVWIGHAHGRRTFGLRTPGGAVLGTDVDSAAPQAAAVIVGTIDGGTVLLLDTGRSVRVYAVAGCAIVPTRDARGVEYRFDRGFTGYGTGVGCPVLDGHRRLAGYLATAEDAAGTRWTVRRTAVVLSRHGRTARNGATTTVGRHLPTGADVVRRATSVSCGDGARVTEPSS